MRKFYSKLKLCKLRKVLVEKTLSTISFNPIRKLIDAKKYHSYKKLILVDSKPSVLFDNFFVVIKNQTSSFNFIFCTELRQQVIIN